MKKRGFTLVELLVAIVIVGVVAGIGLVSYRSIFNNAENQYYSAIESNILLAGNDYFEDHRDELPVGNEYSIVSLSDLIDLKYIEEVKDSKGTVCRNGSVFVYRENNKFKYETCIECGEHKSGGRFCNGAASRVITVTARKAVSNEDWTNEVRKSYKATRYSKGENVIATFSMESEYKVVSYRAYNTKSDSIDDQLFCNVGSENSCSIEIEKSGTYRVVAYDIENKEISSRYINVRIAKNGPGFTLDGLNEYVITKEECHQTAKKIAIININPTTPGEEYKLIEYQAIRDGVTVATGEPTGLKVEIELESGHYDIEIAITNYSDSTNVESIDVDVAYLVDIEYEDNHETATHKVVKGQIYNFKETLPAIRQSSGLDIRWFKGSTQIYPDTTKVTDDCTHKLVVKTAIQVPVIDFSSYCVSNLKYNNTDLTLAVNAPENVTFINNSAKTVGDHTVYAHIETPQYIWSDGTTSDKSFTCTIQKGTNPIKVTANQSWETSYSANVQEHTFTAPTKAQGVVTYSLPTNKNSAEIRNIFSIGNSSTNKLTMAGGTTSGSYTVVVRATAAGNDNYNSGYKDITITVGVGTSINPITVTSPQTWDVTFGTSAQTKTFTAASDAEGSVTYSVPTDRNNSTIRGYFSIANSSSNKLTMAANTPVGTYTVIVAAEATGNANYSARTVEIEMTITVSKRKCSAPTNVTIGADGKVTWTPSSNCSTAQHQVKVASGSYANATSGVDKKNDIIAATGSRTVYVRAVAPNDNYSNSSAASKSVDVYNVTLTKGTGISAVTGAGKYISGATVTLGATASSGYTWSKWTNTSGGSQVSTTNAYSTTISNDWDYTAKATANSYKLSYSDNIFSATTHKENGLTATYTENGNYLVLNGTATTTTMITLWNLEKRSFATNDKYTITIKYVSGSLTCSDSTDCTGSNGRPVLVTDLTVDGNNFSDRTTAPVSRVDVQLPTSGNKEGSITVAESRKSANGLKFWIWQRVASNATFSNYKVQILITKEHSKNVTFNNTYGDLNTPTRTGYDFDGWYTEPSGGTKITSTSKYTTVGNQTLYAQYTSHKLYIQYNGNGSGVTWCSSNSTYAMDSDKFEIVKSTTSKNIQTIAYGQYVSYKDGLNNYHNESYTCFDKEGYTAVSGKEWGLNGKSTKYSQAEGSLTAQGISSDAGCDLVTKSSCTGRLDVNWKSANPITVTSPQSWTATYSTSTQTYDVTEASNAGGTVTYAINSQPSGNYFSISGRKITMKEKTPAGSYAVVVRATAAGNDNYISGYKDITVNVTVGKATGYINLSTTSGSVAYGTASADCFSISSSHGGSLSVSDNHGTASCTLSGTSVKCSSLGAIDAGTSITVTAKSAATTNYTEATKTYKLTINRANNSVTITEKTYTYDGGGKATSATAKSGTPTVVYYSDSGCKTKTTTTNATSAGGTPKNAGVYYAIGSISQSTNYNAADSGCKRAVTINKAKPGLSMTETKKSVDYNGNATYGILSNIPGSYSSTSDNGSIVTAAQLSSAEYSISTCPTTGGNKQCVIRITGVKAGSANITHTFTPTDTTNYETATISMPVTVKYTIIFNGNGGTGTTNTVSCALNENCTIPVSGFDKSNSSFLFWSTSNATSIMTVDHNEYAVQITGSNTTAVVKEYETIARPKANEKYGVEVEVMGTAGTMNSYLYGSNQSSRINFIKTVNSDGVTKTNIIDGYNTTSINGNYKHYSVEFTASNTSGTENKHLKFVVSGSSGSNGYIRRVYFYKKAGSEAVYSEGRVVKNLTSTSITLYAIWGAAPSSTYPWDLKCRYDIGQGNNTFHHYYETETQCNAAKSSYGGAFACSCSKR